MVVFSIVMLVTLEAPKKQRLCTPSDVVGAEKGEKGTKSSSRFVGFWGIRRGEQQKRYQVKSCILKRPGRLSHFTPLRY